MRSSSDIMADITAAYEARRLAMTGQMISLDTGQGKQTVQRGSLSEINKTIRMLETELETAQDQESGGNGIVSGSFKRY